MQTGGKLGEDGHGAQMWEQDSVRGHPSHVCMNFCGRGGWHCRAIKINVVFWGGCLGCCDYRLVVVYQNRSFLSGSSPMGKGGEWTF